MHPNIVTIGNYTITGYGLCIAIAIIAAYFTTEIRIKRSKLDVDIALPMVASAVIPGFIGAKIFYIVQSLISGTPIDMRGGFVIYGGIIVAIPSVYICLRIKKVDILKYMDVGIASIAIAQSIGRIGCLLAGCCYGKFVSSYDWYAITINGYATFPVQIICSVLDMINFIFLIALNRHVKIKGFTLSAYMITYGIGRFIIEFFRGDDIRGFIGALSVSQVISIFSVAVGVILQITFVIKERRKEEHGSN